ncbi:MAG: MORN repeat-containing protein [Suilimivivens sp.]
MQYISKLIMAVISRLKALTLNPVRNFLRKIQMMFNTNVIANKILKPVTKKFRDLFHIKPKSEDDYYSVGRLLIAKKLVAAVIVVCCIAIISYFALIAEPIEQPVTTTTGVKTNVYYDYDDIALTEYTGKANIRAANDSVVYIGDIKSGVCEGTGILYNQSGVLVYEGDFANNSYNGHGKGYAQDGSLRYEGGYVDNVYEGEGTLYYPSGKIQYTGGFTGGFYSGNGFLYGESGELIYEGTFQNGLYHGNGILYYEDGDRKYEGEFVMGKPQGTGTLFTSAGRPYYTGIVANGDIAYESLVSLSLKQIEEMFYEEPAVYYTLDSTCYVYETAQIALELDCIVRIVTNKILEEENPTETNAGDGWYLPEEAGDAVILDNSQSDEPDASTESKDSTSKTDENQENAALIASLNTLVDKINAAQDEAVDEDMPTEFITEKQKIYYYVNNSEWVAESDMDEESVKVEGVTVYKEKLTNPFKDDKEFIAANGVTELMDCIAIEKIRKKTPTAFSNITFEEVNRNYRYTYVKNINYAQAIYEELIDTADFSYQLCYQIDDAEVLYYYKISGIQ